VRRLIHPVKAFRTPTFFPMLAVDHVFINVGLRPLSLGIVPSSLASPGSLPLVAELVRA
jgi:hypothetical protein